MSSNTFINTFVTVFSGVAVYVAGQLVLKLLIEPVHEMKKTIGQISHSLIEHDYVINNPGESSEEAMDGTSRHLLKLSSQLQAHLYLVPVYRKTARLFNLPRENDVRKVSKALVKLSNNVFRARVDEYKENVRQVRMICESLRISPPDDE